ncbi:hypothetical protein C8034_v005882 [Colletotrichum sidae]|uniref:Arrestin n=1 Tax=Colletotrichum sidae TaxID=1347389 RepID=A0A4V6QFT0_9PEZI|nr:hypothetical protein C8034_v005882 [Colletotrichum sidae]
MSNNSDMSSVLSFGRQPVVHRKQSIEVKINDHYTSKVYTSGSPISGHVVISPNNDSRFDYVQIVLLGTSRTRLDAVQIPQLSSHTFLKLEMPIPESAYPVPRIFEAGRNYTIPFNFVIPHQLTISACTHKAQSDLIHDYHMRLPPSMGSWEKDDMTPDMAQIHYAIKARVVRQDELAGRPVKVMEDAYLLNVLPASPEDPPLNITKQDKNYSLSKTKTIRKNLFSSKQGRVTASAAQPGAVYLSSDGRSASEGSIMVNLNFEPASADIAPPKIGSVSGKIQAQTWYGATPMTRLPNLGDSSERYTLTQQLAYSTSTPLFSATVEKTVWRQQLASISRRDSGYSSDGLRGGSHSDSDSSRGRKERSSPIYHIAALQVPFNLPTMKKTFIPTFHACIVSRTYTVQLTLNVGDTKMNLSIPLQIVVGPSAQQDTGLPSFDAAMAQQEEAEADDFLRPRLLQQPAPELQGNAVLPGYDDFSRRRPALSAA